MNLKEIEKVVGMIQSHIFKKSNSYTTGMLKSHFRGSGLQFREHQIYIPGDDVRFIDWKLSARSTHVHIKTFEEERNVEIVTILDLSPTLLYGENMISKLHAIIEITALLYLVAGETHDLVRVVIIKDTVTNLQPSKGREGLTQFISTLEKLRVVNSQGKVNLNPDLYINSVSEDEKIKILKMYLAKRKEVIFLSDFSLIKNQQAWSKIFNRNNMHSFRIFGKIDENVEVPFFMKAKSVVGLKDKGFFFNTRDKGDSSFLHKKIKSIGVHERYLEKFVRELV